MYDGKITRFPETYRRCEGCLRPYPEDHAEASVHRIRQAVNHCTFVHPRLWRDARSHERHYVDVAHMGGELDADENEIPESNDDGCPGGWYRTPFFWSLGRYLRPLASGVYSPNLSLERTADRLVLDAVQFYETEQARASNWAQRVMAERDS